MPTSPDGFPRLISRTFLILTAATVCVAMLVGILAMLVLSGKGPTRLGSYTFSVRYVPVPPMDKAQGDRQPLKASNGDAFVQHETVLVTTSEQLTGPIQLTNVAIFAPYVVFYLACVLLLVLIRRVWTGRSFTRLATGGLGLLGILVVTFGALVPWLELRAVELAVQQLGLPVKPSETGSGTSGWVVPQPYGLESVDWPMVILGVVLVFLAILLHRGTRLQDDVEGLV